MIDTTKTIREVRYNGTAIPLLGGVDNPIVVTSDAEMEACLNDDKYLGMYVKFSGESENYLNGQVYKIAQEGEVSKFYQLPTLDNEGTAADLATGKQLIGSNGKIITGTGTIATEIGTDDFWVKIIDYDGTVLLEKHGNNGDSFDLPSAPSHEGLVFQEWSASCPITDGKVVIDNNNIMVGAVYTTTSGKNEFDITLTKVTGLSITLNMDGTKDWGDGTSDTETTHTYTAYGDYTILCDGTKMTTSSSAGLFGQSSGANNDYCTRLRFAGVTSIGSYACYKCYSLTSITIPNSVTSIGDYAYYYCYSLMSVTIPKGVTSIGANAFVGTFLTDITIPNSVTSIGDSAFLGTSLTNITIPNSVTSIGDYAFRSCRSLTSITIPSSVTSISSSAFRDCYSLTNITIPSSVTSIRDYACFNCCSLTDITIPNGVTSIGASAFKDCYSLTNITIPNSVKSIESDAFSGCRSLTSITIPSSVTSIRGYAFGFCYSLTRCDFSRHTSVPTLVNTGTFANINAICKIIVPDNLYDRWIAASNWSTYADYIYKASEVSNE